MPPTRKPASGRPAPKQRPKPPSAGRPGAKKGPTPPASSSAPAAPVMNKKARRMSAEIVTAHLQTRPEPKDAARIASVQDPNSKVSPGLTSMKRKLERRMSSDTIKNHLSNRPEDITALTPSAPVVAAAIEAPRRALARRMSIDAVNGLLANRPEAERLEPVGVIHGDSKVSTRIAATSRKLQRKMSADNVKSLLNTRPTLEQLQDYNIMPKTAPSIHNQVKTLQRRHSVEKLRHHLSTRPDPSDLSRSGVLQSSNLAPSLHEPSSAIHKHIRRKSLEMNLENRPDLEAIKGYAAPVNFYNDGNSDTNYGGSYARDEGYDDDDIYYEKAVEEDYEDDSSELEVGRWGVKGYGSSSGSSGNGDYVGGNEEEEDDEDAMPELDERMVYAIALRAAAQLEQGGFIDHVQKAGLKERILDGDEGVVRCVVEFVETNDASRLMLVFQRLSQQRD